MERFFVFGESIVPISPYVFSILIGFFLIGSLLVFVHTYKNRSMNASKKESIEIQFLWAVVPIFLVLASLWLGVWNRMGHDSKKLQTREPSPPSKVVPSGWENRPLKELSVEVVL